MFKCLTTSFLDFHIHFFWVHFCLQFFPFFLRFFLILFRPDCFDPNIDERWRDVTYATVLMTWDPVVCFICRRWKKENRKEKKERKINKRKKKPKKRKRKRRKKKKEIKERRKRKQKAKKKNKRNQKEKEKQKKEKLQKKNQLFFLGIFLFFFLILF